MASRGRPEKLTDEIKQYITEKKFNPKATMKEIRSHVRLFLIDKLKRENPKRSESDIIKEVDSPDGPLPGESAISKYMTDTVKNMKKPHPLDNPWHMGLLKENPFITAEAIKHIIAVQKEQPDHLSIPYLPEGITRKPYADDKHEKQSKIIENEDGQQYLATPVTNKEPASSGELIIKASNGKQYRAIALSIPLPVTIRQAIWISRLYSVPSLRSVGNLSLASLMYSWMEIISYIADVPFDTTSLDKIVAQDKPKKDLDKFLQRFSPEEMSGLDRYFAANKRKKEINNKDGE